MDTDTGFAGQETRVMGIGLGISAGSVPGVASHTMAELACVVRGAAAEMLSATDTRIIKAVTKPDGWHVEIESFSPNPELTVSSRGGAKSILERKRYRMNFNADMQLTSLEPVEE